MIKFIDKLRKAKDGVKSTFSFHDDECSETRAWSITLLFSFFAILLWFFEPLLDSDEEVKDD